MSGKINVLGVEIDNLEVAKAMEKTQSFLGTEMLNTIEVLTTGMLLKAGEDVAYKEIIELLDMSIVGDKKILQAAEIEDYGRQDEVESNLYLMNLFAYADDNKTQFTLLCETSEEQAAISAYFEKEFPNIMVEGAFSLDDMQDDADGLVNQINGSSPEIILSTLGSPEQEIFLVGNRGKLNAKIWLGIGKILKTSGILELRTGFLGKMIENRIFKKKIVEYQQEKGDL